MNVKTEKLKRLIKKLFKSQKYFSEQYYIENYVNYDEEDLYKFFETFRGHLKRDTTPDETIEKYLNFIYSSDEFKKSEEIKSTYFYENDFDDIFNKEMQNISKKVSEKLEE
ncbi:hypothetical protein KJ877_02840 [bacterium]|nr:hypothetical protein [bacterium]MBU1989414.1 hypothetical protein [bacterium]